MFWLLIALSALLAVLVYLKVKKIQSYWKEKGVSYVEPTWFVGNMDLFGSKSFHDVMLGLYRHFPSERYHGFYQFLHPGLIIKDPDLIKQIAVKEFDSFLDHKPFVCPNIDPIWDRNLFATRGGHWRDMRTTLSPSFTGSKMKSMFPLMDECAQNLTEFLKFGDNSEIIELEMKEIFTRYTNDVIATTAFGLKCDSFRNENNDFYLMRRRVTDFGGLKKLAVFIYSISPTLAKLLRIKMVSTQTADFFTKIIKETIATRERDNIVRPDMINLLMEAKKDRAKLSDQNVQLNESFFGVPEPNRRREITTDDIVAQAFFFFFAGFETVSTLLSFLFYELAINTQVQNKLRDEIEAVSKENSGKISYEELLGMKFLDMVVSEGLRKWPSPVVTDRVVTKPFTIQPVRPGEKPLSLEVGTGCLFPILGIHRDSRYYDDPERFDPERFSEENRHKIRTNSYFPFGVGPRNCLGSRFGLLETKLVLYYVLGNFEVVPVERTPIPLVIDPTQLNPVAKGGMWLGFRRI